MYNLAYAKPDAINAADAAKKADMGPLIRFMLSSFGALWKRRDSRSVEIAGTVLVFLVRWWSKLADQQKRRHVRRNGQHEGDDGV